jgi:uncharacterized OB-fold protein
MAIIPGRTELTSAYWEAASDGRLVVQQCRSCGQCWHPPLPACPHCHGTDLGWRELSGAGTVYTYTVVRHATHVALADQVPYVVAIVELAEGPRLVTRITGCPPGEVRAGMPVRVCFRPVADGVKLAYFEPG